MSAPDVTWRLCLSWKWIIFGGLRAVIGQACETSRTPHLPPPSLPGGVTQNQGRDPEQQVRSAVQIPTLTSLNCFAFYNFIRTLVKKFFFCFYQVATSYFCVSKNLKRRLNLNTSFILNSQFRREQLTASCSVKLLLS